LTLLVSSARKNIPWMSLTLSPFLPQLVAQCSATMRTSDHEVKDRLDKMVNLWTTHGFLPPQQHHPSQQQQQQQPFNQLGLQQQHSSHHQFAFHQQNNNMPIPGFGTNNAAPIPGLGSLSNHPPLPPNMPPRPPNFAHAPTSHSPFVGISSKPVNPYLSLPPAPHPPPPPPRDEPKAYWELLPGRMVSAFDVKKKHEVWV
jgi:hypothetical protein